jgi:magnesium transporter
MNDIIAHDSAAAAPDLLATTLACTLAQEHIADIVETLNDQDTATIAGVLVALPFERAVEVLDQPELADAPAALALLADQRAAAFLSAMSADRVADVVRAFDEPVRARLLARVDHETRSDLTRLLAYPEHSAGSIMTTEFVSVPANWTVAQTLDHIRHVERSRETVYAIYVLDPVDGVLVCAVPLRRLISGDPDAPVGSVVPARKPISVTPATDREDVARLISKYNLLAVPVVDADHVIGIVTVDDVIDAMIEETTEDVQKLGGMEALDEPYNEIGFLRMIRKRAGWLSILLVGEMLTASAMQYFQDELEKAIVLTLFIPLIMSSGGNSGSQATSLIIRALALREISLKDWWRVALRELPTGLTLGAILGAIGIAASCSGRSSASMITARTGS